ncbi:MAG: hypothetical protein B7O98_02925 [Zestosphaera tikiterensis]|uniref:Aldehyde ferredoxin oxidoreductase N-terminal domain-containing protein n=1 Tax=Zestosphaera tikiterensis TaxID=1973259 RepID=A0A2R7Y949_9CREN|nr:MAG: hypothetical protein B7O98_02925 [Zestosphaera tikiterensis]
MSEVFGYMGKIAFVDLTREKVVVKDLPKEWIYKFIGGEGFGAKILWDLLPPKVSAFSPLNPIIFTTGPLTATMVPASGRTSIVFKSPLTGTIGASNVGGFFAPNLKKAGFDVLVVTGKAKKPVYLWVHDGVVEIRSADHVWGLDVEETTKELLKETHEKASVACIGPAGENLVLFASIMVDGGRAAGRGGGGAVMGSKNLKAVVAYGTKEVPVKDPEMLRKYALKAIEEIKAEPFTSQLLAKYGTPAFTKAINDVGILPSYNWQRTTFDKIAEIDHEAYHRKLRVKPWPCYNCPVVCGRYTEIPEGKYAGEKGHGPEYEAVAAFGTKLGISDLYAIAMANYLSNRLGLDVISTGQVIATAMEWYERGIIDSSVTDGIELRFGNADAVIEMIKKIAYREGFGNLLAEGSYRAALKIGRGAINYVMHVKGMEMAADGVRASKGEVVTHATSERGADHLRPYASAVDAFGYIEPELGITEKKDPLKDTDKAWVKPFKEYSMLFNMLGMCYFTGILLAVKPSTLAGLFTAVTGINTDKETLLKSAERVINLERAFNAREGFTRKDDTLPERFLKEPAPDGRGKGQIVNLNVILDEYYEAMGWDKETGLPTVRKLKELDLEDVALELLK